MPDAETPVEESVVEELRELNEAASDEMAPYEVLLRQMMLTSAAVLVEAGGCESCVAILRAAAVAGITPDEDAEEGAEDDGPLTCEATRGRYRCTRPPFHIPSDLHATTSGNFTVYWRDHEGKVTMKLSPPEEVLAMLRSLRRDSEEESPEETSPGSELHQDQTAEV